MPTDILEAPSHVPGDRIVDFDLYDPPGLDEGFHGAWAGLMASNDQDIVWTPRNGGHWIALRGRLMREIFADYRRFSSRIVLVPKVSGEHYKMMPMTLDPPAHRSYRNLLNSSLSPKAVAAMEARIRRLAITLIEAVRAQGQCNFTTAYAEVLPIHIFLSMIDLPPEDAGPIRYLIDQINRPDGSMSFDQAIQGFYDYLAPIVDARKGKDGDDLLTRLINGTVDGRPVTREEALELGSNILMGGLDTVTNFLGFVMRWLAEHPAERRRLAEDRTLIPAAIEEFLRRFPIVIVAREVVDDIDYEGVHMRKGDMVVLGTPIHGLDPSENICPMDVRFERDAREFSTFGNGNHRCAGAYLARTELRITLEEWLARIPEFSIDPAADIKNRAGIVGSISALPLTWDVATTREVVLPMQ